MARGMRHRPRDHQARSLLSEEHGAAQVDRKNPVEILRLEVEEIAADRRTDAGIVDEAVEPAEELGDRADRRRMLLDPGEVAFELQDFGAVLAAGRRRLLRGFEVEECEVVALARQRLGGGAPDAAGGAGDEGDGTLAHALTSAGRAMPCRAIDGPPPAGPALRW